MQVVPGQGQVALPASAEHEKRLLMLAGGGYGTGDTGLAQV